MTGQTISGGAATARLNSKRIFLLAPPSSCLRPIHCATAITATAAATAPISHCPEAENQCGANSTRRTLATTQPSSMTIVRSASPRLSGRRRIWRNSPPANSNNPPPSTNINQAGTAAPKKLDMTPGATNKAIPEAAENKKFPARARRRNFSLLSSNAVIFSSSNVRLCALRRKWARQ